VFFFTGAFILFGALKSRSISGIISLAVFVFCAIIFFIYNPDSINYSITEYAKKAYSSFRILNMSLYNTLGFGNIKPQDESLYTSAKAIAVMRFIAFAYTYHYLNWFSKTTVIKWNQLSKKRLTVIMLLWIASVALYAINYTVGFYGLFLLSMLHVFFEFPLNHHTFIGIGKEISSIVKK
jgi:hypothetical protein